MQVINVKKAELIKSGINSFEEWSKDQNNIYIGRNMDFYVKGTNKSKWANPYTLKKYKLEECLSLYEDYIRNSNLYNELEELAGKILGCWCKPEPCHGDILIKLLCEKSKKH
jgi:hypothetical protein